MKKFAYSVLLVAAGGLLTLALARPAGAEGQEASASVNMSDYVQTSPTSGYWLVSRGSQVYLVKRELDTVNRVDSEFIP